MRSSIATSTLVGVRRGSRPSSAVSALLSSPNKQTRTHSDASHQSDITEATSGSISSGETDKCHNGGGESPAEEEKKFAQSPQPVRDGTYEDSNLVTKRRIFESMPEASYKTEIEEGTSTFDMSDFDRGDVYQANDSLRNSDRRPLAGVPEEGADIVSPPSSLADSSLLHSAHALNVVVSPPSKGISPADAIGLPSSSLASSASTVQSMELHTTRPRLYSAIGSLEKHNPQHARSSLKSSCRQFEFRTSEPLLRGGERLQTAQQKSSSKRNGTGHTEAVPPPRIKQRDETTTQSERPTTTSVLRKSHRDTDATAQPGGAQISKPKGQRRKGKRVTIKQQTEERFLPVSEAFTPREKKNIKYKPAEMRTPVQKIGMGTLSRPNFRDALRRVSMIIRQHIVKIEHRFENSLPGDEDRGLFDPAMVDIFSDEQFVTPRYKCTMVRVPMARPATVYGLRKIRLDFSIPTEEEIYEFGHQLFNSVQLSSECSIVCLIYVERLMEVAKVPLIASTWRPIFMCGLLLASKVWQDLASWNIEFASVYPQYSRDAINRLELNFLRMVKWDLYISSSLYAKYYFALRSLVEKQDFRQRYNRMVGGVDNVAPSEALKVQKRTELVKEEALLQLSRSM